MGNPTGILTSIRNGHVSVVYEQLASMDQGYLTVENLSEDREGEDCMVVTYSEQRRFIRIKV